MAADTREFRVHARNTWTDEQWRLHRWAYARLTQLVDQQIGQVLTALREAGLEENTLVAFVSDHGDMDASHHLEHKSVFYDEAARVPLILSWKGVTRPGLVDRQHLVSTGLDLIPTLCDFAGIPAPVSSKGLSVRALAEGRTPQSWRETLAAENGKSRMLRSSQYKYVVYASGARREMLVDMLADPGEMKNLAQESGVRARVGGTPGPVEAVVPERTARHSMPSTSCRGSKAFCDRHSTNQDHVITSAARPAGVPRTIDAGEAYGKSARCGARRGDLALDRCNRGQWSITSA